MKIYDCFIFNNEVEMLELRLNVLGEVIDKFIIIEGDTTFSGVSKESVYLHNKDRFSQWEDKIEHHFITVPNLTRSWDREIYSRNYPLTLPGFEDEDIIITSDVDEIPNPEAIASVSEWISDEEHFTFQMNFYMYYLNNLFTTNWFGTRVATYKYLKTKTLDKLRESTEDRSKITGSIIDGGGWHFSYCGGTKMIKSKIQSFSHTEHNNERVLGSVETNVKEGKDLFNRDISFRTISITEDEFPEYVVNNKEKYIDWII
jgi:hypothetical protein